MKNEQKNTKENKTQETARNPDTLNLTTKLRLDLTAVH